MYALFVIISIFVSPGLSVITYLQKFIEQANWNTKIEKKTGNCLSNPLNSIVIKPILKVTNIIPIISDKPATAWLKKPKLSLANSSVKTRSWIAKYRKKKIFIIIINMSIF